MAKHARPPRPTGHPIGSTTHYQHRNATSEPEIHERADLAEQAADHAIRHALSYGVPLEKIAVTFEPIRPGTWARGVAAKVTAIP